MTFRNFLLALTFGGALLSTLAAAQEPDAFQDLVTDRPDQTESAETIAPRSVQLEVGWGASEEADGVEYHAAPQALARIGLTPRLELRLGWDGWQEIGGDGRSAAPGDGELGAKLRLRQGDDGGPAVALLCGVGVPIGDDRVTADAWDPACRLAIAQDLAGGWSLGYNLGVEWETVPTASGDSTLSRLLYTVALGRGLNDRLGFFVEAFGDVSGSAHGSARHHLDGGFTYLLRDHLQLDAFAGAGLSSASTEWLVGAGLSIRWPHSPAGDIRQKNR